MPLDQSLYSPNDNLVYKFYYTAYTFNVDCVIAVISKVALFLLSVKDH